jgi:hypothetical protein
MPEWDPGRTSTTLAHRSRSTVTPSAGSGSIRAATLATTGATPAETRPTANPTTHPAVTDADSYKDVRDIDGSWRHADRDHTADATEVPHMMSVGTDGWEATKNMSWDQRQSYWESEAQKQAAGSDVKLPSDDSEHNGFHLVGTPEMRRSQMNLIDRLIAAKVTAAGGALPQQSGGRVALPNSQDDAPQREKSNGTINWDQVFAINEVVNPVAK